MVQYKYVIIIVRYYYCNLRLKVIPLFQKLECIYEVAKTLGLVAVLMINHQLKVLKMLAVHQCVGATKLVSSLNTKWSNNYYNILVLLYFA